MRTILAILAVLFCSSTLLADIDGAQNRKNFYFFSHQQKVEFKPADHKSDLIQKKFGRSELKSSKNKLIEFNDHAFGIVTPRIAVQFKDSVVVEEKILSSIPFISMKQPIYKKNLYYFEFKDSDQAIDQANKLYQLRETKFSHPIFQFPVEHRSFQETEPLLDQQWHHLPTRYDQNQFQIGVNSISAWYKVQNPSPIKIAVIDLGFQVEHPDLQDAWAIHTEEIPDNNIDDDGNSYVDDTIGWNFDLDNDQLIYGSGASHGTAVAGILAAGKNGIGGVGVCPFCKLVPLVIYNDRQHAVDAFYYAKSRGVHVISNSWGYAIGTPRTDLLEQTISDVAKNGRDGLGTSIIFAMPNANINGCKGTSPDISAHPDVIAVSSVSKDGEKVEQSGYGSCLKFVGPSSNSGDDGIITTDRTGTKGYNKGNDDSDLSNLDYTNRFHGTSAAAPAVSGVFGLVYSQHPSLKASQALLYVQESAIKPQTSGEDQRVGPQGDVDYDEEGHNIYFGYGVPNAEAAVLGALTSSETSIF